MPCLDRVEVRVASTCACHGAVSGFGGRLGRGGLGGLERVEGLIHTNGRARGKGWRSEEEANE